RRVGGRLAGPDERDEGSQLLVRGRAELDPRGGDAHVERGIGQHRGDATRVGGPPSRDIPGQRCRAAVLSTRAPHCRRRRRRPRMTDAKEMLHRYLRSSREAIVWKLEGLGERDLRWPHTPTGTNLLGLVKHLAGVEFGYLGDTFGRPAPVSLPWLADDAPDNVDMWATEEESADDIVDLYRQAWAHSDATIAALELDAPGTVPWWRTPAVTLHHIL